MDEPRPQRSRDEDEEFDDDPPRPAGVHAAQPFLRSPAMRWLMPIGLVVALVNAVLLAWSGARNGVEVFEGEFTPEQYAS